MQLYAGEMYVYMYVWCKRGAKEERIARRAGGGGDICGFLGAKLARRFPS